MAHACVTMLVGSTTHAPNTSLLSRTFSRYPEDQLKGETPLSVDVATPMTFDLPGFLAKLDDLVSTAEEVRSDLRSLQAGHPPATAKKSPTPKKTKQVGQVIHLPLLFTPQHPSVAHPSWPLLSFHRYIRIGASWK